MIVPIIDTTVACPMTSDKWFGLETTSTTAQRHKSFESRDVALQKALVLDVGCAQAVKHAINLFSLTVLKARTLPNLRAVLELDYRQNVETSMLCKSLMNLFAHGISIDAIYNLPPPMMFTADLTEVWKEWVNLAKNYHCSAVASAPVAGTE